ncbi:hypothetical protein [Lactococcus lactis]|uniref:hypothetical protein n=1 Tax=Lactococcus lactis TaxID=1358 RepID=UPI002415E979|nr:hypothetical protein [Lactococcus lactis]MDG4957321.1 hypothetical protein [Lactococcus lactis]
MSEKKENIWSLVSKFIAGILSLILYIPFSKLAEIFLTKTFSQGIQEAFVFGISSFVSAWLVTFLSDKISGPVMKVRFEDSHKRRLYEVNFEDDLDAPQFIDIIFIGKFTGFQLKVLKKFNAKLKVFCSGDILGFELNEGFSQESGSELVLNTIGRFHASKQETSIHEGIQVVMISRGEVELKIELDCTECKRIYSVILKRWYKFNDFDLKIKG